jgi:hypothetical protein
VLDRQRLPASLLRALPILLLGAVIGAAFLSPVSAHFTPNTKHLGKHAWKQTVKKKADKRYARGNIKYIRSDSESVGNGLDRTIEVACPDGWHPTAGGVTGPGGVQVAASHPSDGSGMPGHSAWRVIVRNGSGGNIQVRGYVVCAKVGRTTGNFKPGDPF